MTEPVTAQIVNRTSLYTVSITGRPRSCEVHPLELDLALIEVFWHDENGQPLLAPDAWVEYRGWPLTAAGARDKRKTARRRASYVPDEVAAAVRRAVGPNLPPNTNITYETPDPLAPFQKTERS